MTRIGAHKAKTHLSRLLQRVEAGESIIITRHGHDVAHLIPPPHQSKQADMVEVVKKWKEIRKGLTLRGLKVGDLIAEGRP